MRGAAPFLGKFPSFVDFGPQRPSETQTISPAMMRDNEDHSDSDGKYSTLPEAAIAEEETSDMKTPSEEEEGMLPRDVQQKTAYYDYAAEKQLSQADSKLFYQRSQLEAQKTEGSNWGASQGSPQASPVIIPRSFSNHFEAGPADGRQHAFSQRSVSITFLTEI